MSVYDDGRYRGLNYIEKELAKSIDDLSKQVKSKLGIEIIYFDKKVSEKCGVSRLGFFPHVRDGLSTTVSSWEKIRGQKLVQIKKMLENKQFYGFKNINGQNCKISLKNRTNTNQNQ